MTFQIPPQAKAALFDIDGTLTAGGDFWGVLIQSPAVSGWRRRWLYAVAMPHYLLSKMGIASQAGFRDRWVRLMAGLMKGWTEAQVAAICSAIVQTRLVPSLRPDVVAILDQHRARGHPVILVSTMFTSIVGGLAERLGATVGLGTQVDFRDGRCTGRIQGHPCAGARKLDFVQRYLEQHVPSVALNDCAAYGDSRSDVPFLAGAGFPVATYPDEMMRAAAVKHGWPVYEGRTTTDSGA